MEQEITLEKKVYSPWAYTENESEKSKINYEIFKELRDKANVISKDYGYGNFKAFVIILDKEHFKDLENEDASKERKEELLDELALIADNGNLCFGYKFIEKMDSCESWTGEKYKDVYKFRINTD